MAALASSNEINQQATHLVHRSRPERLRRKPQDEVSFGLNPNSVRPCSPAPALAWAPSSDIETHQAWLLLLPPSRRKSIAFRRRVSRLAVVHGDHGMVWGLQVVEAAVAGAAEQRRELGVHHRYLADEVLFLPAKPLQPIGAAAVWGKGRGGSRIFAWQKTVSLRGRGGRQGPRSTPSASYMYGVAVRTAGHASTPCCFGFVAFSLVCENVAFSNKDDVDRRVFSTAAVIYVGIRPCSAVVSESVCLRAGRAYHTKR